MKLFNILILLMAISLLSGCANPLNNVFPDTTASLEHDIPIEYHDKQIALKSGELLYYRYVNSTLDQLSRVYHSNLESYINQYPLVAKVLLNEVRPQDSLAADTVSNHHKTALAYKIQIQEIYHQNTTWTDTMTQEVNNGLVYSCTGNLITNTEGNNSPILMIDIVLGLETTLLLEDTEYYIALQPIDGYYFVIPIGEVAHPFPWQSQLITAWGDKIEVTESKSQPPALWEVHGSKIGKPHTQQFQAYIRYTLKDEAYYQTIKDQYPLTYEEALNLLEERQT